ncbi:MAG: glycerol kinase GlpK, partial [Candidatus Thermoplasmatota archaeon]|nr:glycerol kinase GlpK [Candidatus Thermoplasmatota archaeon]
VWQCRRTAPICDGLKKEGYCDEIREKTGLVVDAYFSGTKIKWILDNAPEAKKKAKEGKALFGNIDTWLIWKLTGGKVHATDYSNASRTMIYNIRKLKWDADLCETMGIPMSMLPEVKPSSGLFGYTEKKLIGAEIPIAGDAGDQQAALFGQACHKPGMAKNTYGTGSFMLMNTGDEIYKSKNGLVTTIAWGLNGKVDYALEGSVFITGAAVQWLRDGLKIINKASETEAMAKSVPDTGGLYFVPAFVGLGAPYWDMYARGTIVGITRGTTREHMARAALEAIAFQTNDVLTAMAADSKINLKALRVDGGGCANNFTMQFQADVLGVPVERPKVVETTALGAAYLAGLAVDYWHGIEEIAQKWKRDAVFEPSMTKEQREKHIKGWKKAVERASKWHESDC